MHTLAKSTLLPPDTISFADVSMSCTLSATIFAADTSPGERSAISMKVQLYRGMFLLYKKSLASKSK